MDIRVTVTGRIMTSSGAQCVAQDSNNDVLSRGYGSNGRARVFFFYDFSGGDATLHFICAFFISHTRTTVSLDYARARRGRVFIIQAAVKFVKRAHKYSGRERERERG